MSSYFAFFEEQPTVLPAVASAVRAAVSGRAQPPALHRISLVGAGTSFHACLAMQSSFTQAGGVDVVTPPAFVPATTQAAGHWVIVLSQGGASTSSVAAARSAVAAGHPTLVLTAEAASPITATGATVVVMPVGPEPIGPKTKGYTASLVALQIVADVLAQGAVGSPALSTATITAARAAADVLAASLDAVDFILVAGHGRHAATALEASLKINEVAGLPSAGFDTEEALHGRFHALGPHSLALLIVTTPAERDEATHAARVMAERGVRVRLINLTNQALDGLDIWHEPHPMPAPLDTVTAILPLQALAGSLAQRRGLDPDAMRYPGLSRALAIKL